MAYHVNQVKDHEIPGVLYLIDQILDDFFGKDLTLLNDNDYRSFISAADDASFDLDPISITVVKSIFKLFEFDSGYRPKYSSLDFLIYGLLNKKVSFHRFIKNNKADIQGYFSELNYDILARNFQALDTLVKSNAQIYTLDGIPSQVDFVQGYVKKFFDTITHVVGDLSEQTIKEKTEDLDLSFGNRRIVDRIIRKERQRQMNIEQIIAKTLPFVQNKESSSLQPEDDWITDFFEVVQDTSDERMQYLWAKLLANEVDEPGSYSRRSLNAVKLLSSQEASLFSLLCNCLWEIHPGETRSDLVLVKNSDSKGYYSDVTWGFDGTLLRHLEDLGLVHETFLVLEKDEVYNISYFGKNHKIGTKENAEEIELVRLSTVGAEIYNVVTRDSNEEYYRFTLDYFERTNLLRK